MKPDRDDLDPTNPKMIWTSTSFSIEWDDTKANAGAAFTKHIGIYFAQISSSSDIDSGGTDTDLKFLDLYTGFFFTDLAFRNEILFRMGQSAAPAFARLGGSYPDNANGAKHTNFNLLR